MQRLYKLELPRAMPTIVAGMSQSSMPALHMAPVAAMIRARTLADEL